LLVYMAPHTVGYAIQNTGSLEGKNRAAGDSTAAQVFQHGVRIVERARHRLAA
jgi:hypothetical protein